MLAEKVWRSSINDECLPEKSGKISINDVSLPKNPDGLPSTMKACRKLF